MHPKKRIIALSLCLHTNNGSVSLTKEEILADWMIGGKKLSIVKVSILNVENISVEITDEESGKVGALTMPKWRIFGDNIELIKESIEQYVTRGREGNYMLHLGKDQFVSVSENVPCVDIRKWFYCQDCKKLSPTKCDIALRLEEFQEFYDSLTAINEELDLSNVVPCQYTHSPLDEAQKCGYCTPSGN